MKLKNALLKKKYAWDKAEKLQLGEWEADREKRRNNKKPPNFNTLYGSTVSIFCVGSKG